ncbi:MAG: 2-hydroxyglutaryl-CoA dehydratase [Firmicutes bacterium HGW-Firmicutes-1]|jgi:predicted nucleotide-binding protein (sugar kinase/HSP70/actin superfamily)|nr:MAG: 2-hydroxyglutaryl-CoA dehydratase [Firmicutes bacterium HGW-Firmicutes-1]
MKVGLPKGLLYYRYHPFFKTFFEEIGAELIISADTNKVVMDAGIRCCTSEACLPIKIFHGHVDSIKNQCDLMVVPRIMKITNNEYICPHLCSLPEMVVHSMHNLPQITYQSLYFNSQKQLYHWAKDVGKLITPKKSVVENAFYSAMVRQLNHKKRMNQTQYRFKILLLGHGYNIYDSYVNMNIIKKLNELDIGVISSDFFGDKILNNYIAMLPRKPFWYYYRQAYGSAAYLTQQKEIDGIIFISCFSCGIDAVISEAIREDMSNVPLLLVKLDEHSGDVGMDTRLEAFSDMLKRGKYDEKEKKNDCYNSALW